MTARKTQTVEIEIHDFADLVNPILPIAGTDEMLPVLTCVKFSVRGGWLLASATDRFRLAVKRVKTDATGFDALVPQRDIRTILKIFKPRRRDEEFGKLTLEHHPTKNELQVSRSDGFNWSFGFIDASLRFTAESGEYPEIHKVINAAAGAPRETDGWFAVNPTYMADWRHAVGRNRPLLIRLGKPNQPILVTADDFIGLQMPLRAETHKVDQGDGRPAVFVPPDDLSDWAGLLEATEAKPTLPAKKAAARPPKKSASPRKATAKR